jgi:hypothetical protein
MEKVFIQVQIKVQIHLQPAEIHRKDPKLLDYNRAQ